MSAPINVAVRNPTRLRIEQHPLERDTLVLTAGEGRDTLTIVASRERWGELFREAMTGRIRDRGQVARAMFERGEIDVEALERALT